MCHLTIRAARLKLAKHSESPVARGAVSFVAVKEKNLLLTSKFEFKSSFHDRWLNVKQAPAPSVIKWENLSYNTCTRFMRRCFSFFVALLLILVSFGFILIAKYY